MLRALDPLGIDVALLPVNGRDSEREAGGIVGNLTADEAVGLADAIGAALPGPVPLRRHPWQHGAGRRGRPRGATAGARVRVLPPTVGLVIELDVVHR